MTPDQYARVKEIFAAAIAGPEAKRDALARQLCDGDELLLREVLSLLQHHKDETLLEGLPANELSPAIVFNPNEHVDPYLVLSDVWNDNRHILRRRLVVLASMMALLIVGSMVRLFTYHYAALGYGVRIAAFAISAGSAWLLYKRPNLSLLQLRIIEAVVLGNAGLLAIVLYIRVFLDAALRDDFVALISINNWNFFLWTFLIFVYGVFMPNTWQRAATVLLPAAAIPSMVLAIATRIQPSSSALLEMDEYGRPLPAPLLAACVSIYAAHLIHGARLAAFGAKRLGQYRLTRLIGEGGMGRVFEAEHLQLKRPCAIKLIQPERSLDHNALNSFEREVRATARLTHPHTVDVYDYGQTREGLFYCAMELLPGMNLRDLVNDFGPMPPARAVHFLSDVCGALREAHDAGMIHRDVKPANIFASERGGIADFTKLLDFGLVHQTENTHQHDSISDASLEPEMIAGTPYFMSPEQVSTPARLDARTDIYSLGAVGYYLLTGRPPLMGDSPLATMLAHVNETPRAPSTFCPAVANDLDRVIMQCLVKDIESRISSAADLLMQLEQCECFGQWTQNDAKQWWAQHVQIRIGELTKC